MGCIGKDKYGDILNAKASEAGVNPRYMVHDTVPTGTCAVVVTGHDRQELKKEILKTKSHIRQSDLNEGIESINIQ